MRYDQDLQVRCLCCVSMTLSVRITPLTDIQPLGLKTISTMAWNERGAASWKTNEGTEVCQNSHWRKGSVTLRSGSPHPRLGYRSESMCSKLHEEKQNSPIYLSSSIFCCSNTSKHCYILSRISQKIQHSMPPDNFSLLHLMPYICKQLYFLKHPIIC